MANDEELEKEAQQFLAQHFTRIQPVDHVEEGVESGTYVHLQFDTIRNPMGEGDFRVSLVKLPDGKWEIADYEILPQGGHRG